MMTLLARMGLRAGEAAGLRLDDIDWRRGEITIAGKGNRRDQLPLPADAGEAVADWLRQDRPPAHVLVLLRFSGYSDARFFLRVRGPGPGLTRSGASRPSE